MTERQRDMLAYGVVALAGGNLLLWIIPACTPEYPGYGVPASLLPNIAAGFMLALSLLGLVRAALASCAERREAGTAGAQGADGAPPATEKAGKGEEKPAAPRVRWLHLARFLIPCALLMPAMSWIGFIPAGVAFMAVIQYFCGQRRPLAFALVAALPVLAVYAVMRFGLGVPMP